MPFEALDHRIEHGMFVREAASGQASGTPLVWVHGLGESGLGFERIAVHPELAPWRHLIPDLPGYGRTPWTAPPLDLRQQADRLAEWLSGTSRPPAVIVGHSMGGVIGQLLAERHPERVHALVDVDGNVSEGDCVFSKKVVGQSMEAFVDERFDRLCDAIYQQGVEDLPLRSYYASLRLADPRAFYRNAQELVELSTPETLAVQLAALPVPKVYIAGHPHGADARSLELLEQAAVPTELVQPAGHWPFLDRPRDFASRLAAFLRGLPGAPSG